MWISSYLINTIFYSGKHPLNLAAGGWTRCDSLHVKLLNLLNTISSSNIFMNWYLWKQRDTDSSVRWRWGLSGCLVVQPSWNNAKSLWRFPRPQWAKWNQSTTSCHSLDFKSSSTAQLGIRLSLCSASSVCTLCLFATAREERRASVKVKGGRWQLHEQRSGSVTHTGVKSQSAVKCRVHLSQCKVHKDSPSGLSWQTKLSFRLGTRLTWPLKPPCWFGLCLCALLSSVITQRYHTATPTWTLPALVNRLSLLLSTPPCYGIFLFLHLCHIPFLSLLLSLLRDCH